MKREELAAVLERASSRTAGLNTFRRSRAMSNPTTCAAAILAALPIEPPGIPPRDHRAHRPALGVQNDL